MLVIVSEAVAPSQECTMNSNLPSRTGLPIPTRLVVVVIGTRAAEGAAWRLASASFVFGLPPRLPLVTTMLESQTWLAPRALVQTLHYRRLPPPRTQRRRTLRQQPMATAACYAVPAAVAGEHRTMKVRGSTQSSEAWSHPSTLAHPTIDQRRSSWDPDTSRQEESSRSHSFCIPCPIVPKVGHAGRPVTL